MQIDSGRTKLHNEELNKGDNSVMKLSDFRAKMLKRYCRQCINETLAIHLQREDCCYSMYQNKCHRCGDLKNIVEDLRWNAKYKVLLAKSEDEESMQL